MAKNEEGFDYPSRAYEIIPSFSGVLVAQFLVFYEVLSKLVYVFAVVQFLPFLVYIYL